MLPLWVYAAVAAVIAAIAFGLAQVAPGLGAMFVAGATTLWTAWSVTFVRRRLARRRASADGR